MIYTGEISLRTQADGEIIDITAKVQKQLTESGITGGIVTVFVEHSTCGITTVEYEPGLIDDLGKLWEKIAPKNVPYAHDARWGDGNGYAHVRASLLGASLTVPFIDKKLALGTWQQIILVDFDNRPRSRTVMVQVMGE
ncbi:MAG TPA: secondary thiamine-phosphate synthase enzyme YjbQ [Dehalococcoidales bacterium]|jgi:secondary thiamine-phosphate synthase enzyme|nr:secondary thiamine-phosphate synthase enzyme YjbQ [Dehalococcoidales bacterium]